MNALPSLEVGAPLIGSLLPMGEAGSSPNDRLAVRMVIYQRAEEALKAFRDRKLAKFDIPTGDQACQIRALQLCRLELQETAFFIDAIRARLLAVENMCDICRGLERECQEKVATIREKEIAPLSERNSEIAQERAKALKGIEGKSSRFREVNAEFAQKFSLVNQQKEKGLRKINKLEVACLEKQLELISETNLECEVDLKVLFLVRCFLVTLVKLEASTKENGTFVYHTHFNAKKMAEEGVALPTSKLMEILEAAKRAISENSIAFIQNESLKIKGEEGDRLQNILSRPRLIKGKNRSELPFFHLTRVVFQRAMQTGIPIFLKVRNSSSDPFTPSSFECCALFKSNGEAYTVSPVLSDDLAARVIVIEAFCRMKLEGLQSLDYVNTVLDKGKSLIRVIDLNAVQHSQFTDQKVSSDTMFGEIPGIDPPEENRLINLLKEAEELGFSQKNQKLLCIDHIYCDFLSNQRGQ
jgi:hypothetical protein